MAANPIVTVTPATAAFFRPLTEIERRGGAVRAPEQFGQAKSSPMESHTSRWVAPIQQPSRLVQRPGVRIFRNPAPLMALAQYPNAAKHIWLRATNEYLALCDPAVRTDEQ